MAKFCGKCGSKLDEETGLCPRCDNSEEMSQENIELHESNGGPKKTKQHKAWLRVFVVTLVLIVGIGTGAILWVQFGDTQIAKELATSNSELSVISGESISGSIGSLEDAVSVLAEVGPELGYQNAFSELTPVYTQDVLDLTTYRLQQNYEGIPVYGRTASIISDEKGEVVICVNNCEDIDSSNLVNEIKIMEDEAEKTVSEIHGVSEIICSRQNNNSSLLLFKADDGYHYAYVIFALADDIRGSTIEYYIDADDGSVLANYVSICDVSKTVSYYQDGFTVSITELDGELSLIDTSRDIYIYDWKGQNSDRESSEAQLVSCPSGDIFDTSSVQFLSVLSSLYDYFVNNYADRAFGSLIACYNDSADWGRNASGGSVTQNDTTRGYMTVGEITGTGDLDVIGHEYTHIISKHLFNPESGNSESGAINEGLSDLYGSILEAYISRGTNAGISALVPDWIMQGDNINAYRNAIDPSDSGNATTVQDKMGFLTRGDKYYFATIIPRAAYLMWNGIDGDESKKLDTKTLSDLWYLSMTMFPSDVDFETCGFVVESVAALLNSRDIISDAQLSCVDEAFTDVGITGRTDISEYAEKLGQTQEDILPTDHLSPENATTAYANALDKLNGNSLSITKEGSFSADFVNFSELQFTQKMDIQQFGQPTMTASGHYTSTGGSGGSTSEMDYNFTYDSQGMHIPDYEQPVTGELVTLELPPLECVHSYSETGRDGGGKTYLVTYDGETLTQENCGIFSSVLDSSFRIYWSPSEEYADEDGIQQAEVLFSIDNDGNLISIEVSYQMYAGIQGIAPVEGTTTFIFNKIPSNDKKDIDNYFGTWEADPNVTMELTGKSLMSIYGSGISNGSKLVIGEDGFFSFYIGITQDNQGEGTWKWNGSKFSFTLVSYLTQTEVQGYLTVVSYNGVEYLVMNDQGNDIYWKQVKAQDESQDSESLINIIDTDFVLKSLANVGMGDGQITNTEQFTPENWRTLVSMWLEHSYQAYRDNGINAPTPVQREDYIADDSSHCFFNRDALNDAIELFGGNPKDVLTTLCAQNSGNKAIKNQIVVEDDQLIWTIPESEYEPVFDLHLINIAEDSGKVLLTYGYQYGDFGGWTLVYEGTATLVSSNNPLGYEIESYYRQMVSRNQISSSEPSFVDSSFFDKMPSTPIVVEGSGQDVVVTMTISHLQDFIKYDGGNIDLQFSDGTIALKYTFEVEDNAANVDDSVFILTNNSNSELTWMGSGWDDISCSINGDELSWSCSLPKAAFSVEKIKYIGIDVHTSRSRQHLTTYEYRNGDTLPVETSLESPRFAVDWRGYDEFFQ